MKAKPRKTYEPKPHVVMFTEATVYARDADGRLRRVETLAVQWKEYDNRR